MPDRSTRRRLLVQAQTAVAVVAALAGTGLMMLAFGRLTGVWPVIAVMLVVVLVIVAAVVLRWLERAKPDPEPAPYVDWAEELRSVRDSRRVIVAAFEIERRRIERDLHDGAQQYLVAAAIKLGEVGLLLQQHGAGGATDTVSDLVEAAHRDTEEALRSLRSTISGIHPRVLTDLGLHAAVVDLAERSPLEIIVRCPHDLPDMPEGIAGAAWFFCSEALTNTAKYAPQAGATVLLAADQDLHVSIIDNGPGGAYLREGGGLAGMKERLAAFGGTMQLSSPDGGPTTVRARIPLLLEPATGGREPS